SCAQRPFAWGRRQRPSGPPAPRARPARRGGGAVDVAGGGGGRGGGQGRSAGRRGTRAARARAARPAPVARDAPRRRAAWTVAGRYWSSSGGQADFAKGAMFSPGGQAFVVLPSTARDGTVSRIRATLTPGSMVTTLKNTVDHVVTEHGIAELRGRSISERAR